MIEGRILVDVRDVGDVAALDARLNEIDMRRQSGSRRLDCPLGRVPLPTALDRAKALAHASFSLSESKGTAFLHAVTTPHDDGARVHVVVLAPGMRPTVFVEPIRVDGSNRFDADSPDDMAQTWLWDMRERLPRTTTPDMGLPNPTAPSDDPAAFVHAILAPFLPARDHCVAVTLGSAYETPVDVRISSVTSPFSPNILFRRASEALKALMPPTRVLRYVGRIPSADAAGADADQADLWSIGPDTAISVGAGDLPGMDPIDALRRLQPYAAIDGMFDGDTVRWMAERLDRPDNQDDD